MFRRLWKSRCVRLTANIILCAIFVGLVASLAMPAVYEICSPNEYTHAKECPLYHLPQFIFLGAVGVGDAHNGLIIAIATGLLTWITWRLARMEAESGEATKAELRAYVSAMVKAIYMNQDGETLSALVAVHNSGQTPAFNVTIPGNFAIRLPPYEFKIAHELTNNTVANLTTITLPKDGERVPRFSRKFNEVELAQMADRKARFYIYGLIGYTDVFGADMWAEFCAFMEGPAFLEALNIAKANPMQRVEGPFMIAPFGNDTSYDPSRR